MSKETQRNFTIGTIGASNHGKTTLLAAILKLLSDKEQADFRLYRDLFDNDSSKRNEIDQLREVIVAEYETNSYYYTHIDCPGGDAYTENLVAAISRMDCAILVVSAPDSVTSQTTEHLRIAREAGIRAIVVCMNQIDRGDGYELLDCTKEDIRQLLSEHGFDGDSIPIIGCSAQSALDDGNPDREWGWRIVNLLDAIDDNCSKLTFKGGLL